MVADLGCCNLDIRRIAVGIAARMGSGYKAVGGCIGDKHRTFLKLLSKKDLISLY